MKGIDPRAKARAKTIARREGVTLGEWLNRVILEDSSESRPQWDDALEAFPGFSAANGLSEDEDRLLRAMVNRLTAKVESTEENSTRALTGIETAIQRLADKVNDSEARREAEAAELRETMGRVREGQDGLERRVRQIETDDAERGLGGQNAKAVETAVGQLARRLYRTETETADKIDRIESETRHYADTARRQGEAFEDRVKRVEKRGDELEDLAKRRDRRTVEALGGLHQATDGLRRRVEEAERIGRDSSHALDNAIARLEERMKSVETGEGGKAELERRFGQFSDEVARIIAETRRDVARALENAASEPRIDRVESALDKALSRIEQTEDKHAAALSRIGEEITRLAGAVDRRIDESERRILQSAKETRSEDQLDRRFDAVREENKTAVRRMGEEVAKMGRSLTDRVARAEARSTKAVEDAASRMADMVERIERSPSREQELEDRLRQSEERTAERIEAALEGVRARLDQAREETESALSPVERTMTALAERLEAIETRYAGGGDAKAEPVEPARPAEEDDPFEPALTPPEAEGAPGRADATGVETGPVLTEADDPFLAEAEAPEPAAAPRLRPPQARAQAEPAAPAAATRIDPQTAQPAAPQRRRRRSGGGQPPQDPAQAAAAAQPQRPRRVGATADQDFLAAARERTRSGGGFDFDVEAEGGGRGRMMLVALSIAGFLTVGAAATMLVMNTQAPSTASAAGGIESVEARLRANTAAANAAAGSAAGPEMEAAAEAASEPAAEPAAEPAGAAPDLSGAAAPALDAPALDAPVEVETSAPRPIDASANAAPAQRDTAPEPARPSPAAYAAPAPVTLESAAADGDPVARYVLGMRELESGDVETAVALLRRAAEQGVPAAQYRYGKLLETGEGVAEDAAAALRWTERAAQAGHRRAMHNLGLMYASGAGANADLAEAARWFEEAALRGLADSQYNLAFLYERGMGVPQSPADAYAWYLIAAATGGDAEATTRAQQIAAELPQEAIAQAQAAATGFEARPIDAEANGLYSDNPWNRQSLSDIQSVRRAQLYLSALGYRPGAADGVFGDRTREAIMAYETDQGLPRTGRIDSVLLDRLERAVSG